jgi:hypothetical protein
MDNGKVYMFAKGTGLRALLERNGFEFFDYDEETLKATMEEHEPNNVRQEEGASDD